MSETHASPKSADEGTAGAAPRRPGPVRRLAGALLRWTRRIALFVVLVLVIARASLGLWLPPVVEAATHPLGLHVTWVDLDLSILGASLDLTGLRVVALEDEDGRQRSDAALAAAPPIAVLDDLGFDLDVSGLFTGARRIHRVEVSGLEAWVERDEAGAWSLERFLPPPAERDGDADEPDVDGDADEGTEPAGDGADFTPPVELASLSVSGVRVHLSDRAAGLETALDVDALVRDVGHPARPMRLTLSAAAEGVLDSLRVEGAGVLRGPRADLDLDARLVGLGAQRLAPYLALVGIEPVAERLDAALRAEVRMEGAGDGTASGTVRIADVEVRADGDVEAGIGAVEAAIARFSPTVLEIERIGVDGARARAERRADGTLRVAGLDLVGAPSAVDGADDDEESDADPAEPSAPMGVTIDLVEVSPIELKLRDASVTGEDGAATEIDVSLGARVTDVVLGPGAGAAPIALSLGLSVRDAAEVEVEASVELPPAGGGPLSARLGVRGSEVTLAALRPYLASAGIEPILGDGRLVLDAAATVTPLDPDGGGSRIDATLDALRLTDGDATLADLGALRIDGLELPADGALRLAEAGLEGLTLPVTLTEGGGFRAFGIASIGAADAPAEREVGVERGALTVAGLDLGAERSRATLEGTLGLVQVADEVRLDGAIDTRAEPRDVRAEVTLDANALVFEALTPVLSPAGITPTMDGGRLTATARVHLRGEGEEARLDASAESVSLVDGAGDELLALDRASLSGFALSTGDAPQPGVAEVAGVRARVDRRADGVVVVAGLAFDGGVRRSAPTGVPTADPGDGAGDAAVVTPAGPPTSTESGGVTPGARRPRAPLRAVTLSGVEVAWRDAAQPEPVAIDLTASGALQWSEQPDAVGLEGRVALAVPGVVGELALTPALTQRADGLEADVALEGRGLSAGPAAAYAPPGLEILYEDGSLDGRATLSLGPNEDGGQSLEAALQDLVLVPVAGGEPSLQLARLSISAPRLDPAAGVFEIGEVASEGVVATVAETAEGEDMRLEAFGIALAPAPPADRAPDDRDAPAAERLDDDGAEDPGAVAPAAPVSASRAPTVTLGRLDLGIDRLRYVDRTRENATPLDLRLHLTTPGPQTLMQPAPEELEPVRIALEGALEPLASEVRLDLTADLFAPTARLDLDAAIRGIDGAALGRAAPDLAARVDLSAYEDGEFEAHADASLQIPRRGETGFQFGRGITGLVKVGPVSVRPTPEAEPTGFDELAADIARLSPVDGFVHLRSVDLAGIRGHVERRPEGMVVAGALLPTPPPAPPVYGPPAPEPDADADADADAGAGSNGRESGDTARTGEFRVDVFTVHGVDFVYRDTTVAPEFVLPVEDLLVEVQRFSTRALEEPRPISFRARIDAGEVEVPERTGADFLLFDVVGSAADVVTMRDDEFDLVERRMWDLIEVTGRLTLAPSLRGRIQTTVLGLELPAFQGLTSGAGVEIGDGLVDSRAKVRFREDGGLSIDSTTTATYLSLSEPPDGPISKYLSLPAPLDTVLFLLRNDEGAQVLPVRLDVAPGGVSAARIAQLAAETLGLLISDAVASAPLRVLGPLKDIAGPLGLTQAPPTGETVVLEFEPGAATVAASRRQGEGDAPTGEPLAVLADALRRNTALRVVVQADIGAADIEVAARLGNPPQDMLQALLEAKRAQKADVDLRRARLSARVRAQLAIGANEEADRTAEELRVVAVERARVERAIDELFERIRPGAERRGEMRTRNAALALANERQARVRARLLELAGPAAADRVDVRRPRYVPPDDGDDEGSALPERGVVTLTPR